MVEQAALRQQAEQLRALHRRHGLRRVRRRRSAHPDRLHGHLLLHLHALRDVLAGVVQNGTARRLVNAFVNRNGKSVVAGGKTGSGDNRYETRKWSHAVSRTGTFAFYLGDRYFGVMTAYVGDKAANYVFTSALPVTALKLLAPTLAATLDDLE